MWRNYLTKQEVSEVKKLDKEIITHKKHISFYRDNLMVIRNRANARMYNATKKKHKV